MCWWLQGHTRLINFFSIGDKMHLVDMPGYGYKSREEWGESIMSYITSREQWVEQSKWCLVFHCWSLLTKWSLSPRPQAQANIRPNWFNGRYQSSRPTAFRILWQVGLIISGHIDETRPYIRAKVSREQAGDRSQCLWSSYMLLSATACIGSAT